ncbi:RNA-directed DNA polymerase [Cereibacter azotoformans]|uniref:Reverse transcriptase (RNA-dependent DNA polymerase) n=1 Tax=Cereibacter azotoformans TaxID=43057 RepID=A0A2T5JTL4_9RHOB|nr:RNA-directed DNA polymerase [Cereibacter azotoformans]MBO4168843.1 RNA-directed DNA polymerase [Cereibacter azotoformans]PTR13513.1 reverse transcriptase (RNA-dependent DNA polymerase) [Cereibacter azotoformans]
MPLKDDLLRRGYFPENLPPAFSTSSIADYFQQNPPPTAFLSRSRTPVRAAIYNASKRGMTRRVFSAIHPVTAYDTAHFIEARWQEISAFYARDSTSFSVPEIVADSDRALVINSHAALEEEKLRRLAKYRFVACTDVARYFHSIYTHSLPWAFHGKVASKADTQPDSAQVFFNRADQVVRCGQDNQTIGLPVGPDSSRVFAEIVGKAIDLQFATRAQGIDCALIRHVDDVWIGTNTHADAERALSHYREAIRSFELDINEAKTKILSDDFRFTDDWPIELTTRLEFAINSPRSRRPERLRSVFEHAFSMAVSNNDDAILKYIIRKLDQYELTQSHWSTVEPFLKRTVVHFGHVIDYIARVLVWRHLVHDDLDVPVWSAILRGLLERHGRLGNDSEVCWTVYTCIHLSIPIEDAVAADIIRNCGALSICAILNCVALNLVDANAFTIAELRLQGESARGQFWPVILEWHSRQWPNHAAIAVDQDTILSLANGHVTIFDPTARPAVFRDVEEADFDTVLRAIEPRTSLYDDDEEEEAEADDDQDIDDIF